MLYPIEPIKKYHAKQNKKKNWNKDSQASLYSLPNETSPRDSATQHKSTSIIAIRSTFFYSRSLADAIFKCNCHARHKYESFQFWYNRLPYDVRHTYCSTCVFPHRNSKATDVESTNTTRHMHSAIHDHITFAYGYRKEIKLCMQ